ncbi:chromate transporter [Telmatospirillum siberiense]|uniref:Chromate transporter n=1 Tax=Telmatospirillum siberiense TaxID=382514 RepID=A0A2N3PMJ5_9PROT|nr:chromate transporter [Telmatospirillum siberiense]PKU21613.1 chromate transporter [Telmatospirillum siberiense]
MKDGLLGQIATTFASVSLVAVGGANAVMPEIHRQVVDQLHWMDGATFANLFAVAQAAPGPNVLFVSLIGWHMAGFAGLAVATLAIMLPSGLVAFAAGRLVARLDGHPLMQAAKSGLVPIAVGLILASGLVMSRAADHDVLTIAITLGTAAFVFFRENSPLWALAGGALLGIGTYLLGLFS